MPDLFTQALDSGGTGEFGLLDSYAGTIGAEIQLLFGETKATGSGHRRAVAVGLFPEWQALYSDAVGEVGVSMQRQFGGQA